MKEDSLMTRYDDDAVHNEVNWGSIHRHDKIYVIDFMGRKYGMLADICNIDHLCYGQ